MPFAIIAIGLMLFFVAINGTYKQFGAQLYKDLFGSSGSVGFIYWVLAIVIVGMLGYIPGLQKPANAFLGLIVLGVLLANQGLFAKFEDAITSGPTKVSGATPLTPVPVAVASAAPTSKSDVLSTAAGPVNTAISVGTKIGETIATMF